MKKYIMKVSKVEDGVLNNSDMGIDKIGGDPTHLPPEDVDVDEYGYFLMQIYNNGVIPGKEDVLCWQFYQEGEFGGPELEVLEIPVGAKLNTNKQIKKRRWIDEYLINYEIVEEKNDLNDDEFISAIGGTPNEFIQEDCDDEDLSYIGVIYENLCPYNDLSFGTQYVVIGEDSDGNLVVI